jgi:hypothetical protein
MYASNSNIGNPTMLPHNSGLECFLGKCTRGKNVNRTTISTQVCMIFKISYSPNSIFMKNIHK